MELNGGGGGGSKVNQHQNMNGNGFHPTEKTSLVQQAQNAYRLNDIEASRYVCVSVYLCIVYARSTPADFVNQMCLCFLAPATSSSS